MTDLNFPNVEPFPRFQGERLFLASSSDMRHVRLEAQAMLDGLLNRLVTERQIKPYEWETCTAENPFDQRLNMQENLSRPSDPKCVGVICLFGERIGFPLQDFDTSTIPDWDTWSDPKRRFRVVHPWPVKEEEQLEHVREGGFPLSGTVFEALDALGAGRNIHIAYFADRAVTFDDPNVRLNGRNWRMQMSEQLDGDDLTDWLDTDYIIQTRGVTNFLNALNERGRYVPVHQTIQEALSEIRRFVETKIVPVRLAEDNPYRFLDFYDILDGDALPGREEACRKAVAELRARAAHPNGKPMIARISGESGCGKTSFMRAGILAALNRPGELGRFRVVAARPTDFHDENGLPDHHLPARLLAIIAREITDLGLSAIALENVTRAGSKAARLAVEVLDDALAAKGKDAPSIVIGIDQFEEILDDLGAINRRPYAAAWKQLLSFVEIAAKTGRFGFVYTLESSRQELFESIELPAVFRAAHEVRLGGHDDDFLEAIITRPFERAGYRLAPQIVNALLTSYKSYSENTQGYASTLPLLSLKLSNLFDTVQSLRSTLPRPSSKGGLHAQFEEKGAEISYEELKDELRFDNEIEELANATWGTNNKPEDEQIDELNPFLKPLVALDLDRITLQTVADVLFVNLDKRLSAFEDVRLIIRENGRRRLVHEAVIRQWPLAAKWLERKKEYLIDEAKFRADANYWHSKGESEALLPKDEASIEMAAAVLRNYLQEWVYCDQADLHAADRKLKKYCEAIFRRSETPKRQDSKHFRKSYSHIHLAATYGMIDLIERFIGEEPDCLELPAGGGTTPIDHAAWGSIAATRFLLEKGANPVNFDDEGWSTISRAVWRNDFDIFRLLLPSYRTVESIKSPMGTNLLHIAAGRGAVDMAAALLATVDGIDPMQTDEQKRTPLDFAAMSDQLEAFKFFLKYCDIRFRSGYNWTVLHYAAHNGALKVAEEILTHPQFFDLISAPDDAGETALMIAAKQRHDAVVRRLVEDIDPNIQVQKATDKEGWTALHFAIAGAEHKKYETRPSHQRALRTVRALLSVPTIDPTIKAADGKEPVALATSLPHVRRELISHPSFAWSERLSDGSTPLNFIISVKDRHAVERMLRTADLDVEVLSSDGTYALSLLIQNDMADLAVRLFEEGRVNPWNVSEAKDIGLSAAILADHESLITAYLEKLPETTDESHRRLLALAAKVALMSGRSDTLLERLLESGADPELSLNNRGWTLFHYAALVGNLAAFDKFAARSAATSSRDAWGRRPAEFAPDHIRDQFDARMIDTPDEPSASEQ
ncbi:MAG TPA: ankyrin repeat domain-containing protein [Pyrinomonadaceae bacterium]|nr:ankyrin repeat domain-containing protein [Pyrinomonadaceae bacterium]